MIQFFRLYTICIYSVTVKQKQKGRNVLESGSIINTSTCYDQSLVPLYSDFEDEAKEEDAMYDEGENTS